MSEQTVLFVSHYPKRCGVFEFGKNVFNAIEPSRRYRFVRAECASLEELNDAISRHRPRAIIYNYHPWVLPWVASRVSRGIYENNVSRLRPIQIGIIHEVTQRVADRATGYRNRWVLGPSQKRLNSLFDYYIAPDPTLLLKNPLVFKTGRLVSRYGGPARKSAVPVIGSFGFATPNKGFEEVVRRVQEEFDEALVRINMPPADFGDEKGENARRIAENCRALVKKPGIRLEVSHDYLDDPQLLDFLAGQDMNVFLYEDKSGRGLSSAIDNALAVKKPVAVSRCPMFRHILVAEPSVCVEDRSLRDILASGFAPLEAVSKDWNAAVLRWEYERILDRIFSSKPGHATPGGIRKKIGAAWRKFFSLPAESQSWISDTAGSGDDLRPVPGLAYIPVQLSPQHRFNRILDDEARELYQPAVDMLFRLVPVTMNKKIPRANVQQGFVFDTVYRHIPGYDQPRILCVGSYEDTAAMGLRKLGLKLDEVDPMINYYLQEFLAHPSTKRNSYQIIFATSVIEHDPDDASFMRCVEELLAPGGLAVLTCDFRDGWKPGDPKPEVDARFYTKRDLEERLLSYVPNCELADAPDWTNLQPDFNYLGKYQYSFASFVIRKRTA